VKLVVGLQHSASKRANKRKAGASLAPAWVHGVSCKQASHVQAVLVRSLLHTTLSGERSGSAATSKRRPPRRRAPLPLRFLVASRAPMSALCRSSTGCDTPPQQCGGFGVTRVVSGPETAAFVVMACRLLSLEPWPYPASFDHHGHHADGAPRAPAQRTRRRRDPRTSPESGRPTAPICDVPGSRLCG